MDKGKSTALGLFSLAGLAVLLAGAAFAPPSQAQSAVTTCPAAGFDVCFPNLQSGAPSVACSATEPGAAAVSECLSRVCSSAATEPEAGFFSYCCAAGGSVEYDDFCVFALQTACPAVAAQCEDRCPPLPLLIGTVTLAPPPAACIPTYPAFVARVCALDEFCCSTSWDAICAQAALAAGGAALVPSTIVAPTGIIAATGTVGSAGSASSIGAGAVGAGAATGATAASLVNAPAVIPVTGPAVISLSPAAASFAAAP